ncbi:MAG: UrcA family protein [Novosphingobium sp.]|nr:UrcA family protein [Novosphingobium sp.]
MTRKLTALAAAALATLSTFAATVPASAETATVRIADLDLSTAEGQAKLEARIARAARRVCSEVMTGSRIPDVDEACVSKARASLDRQIAARRAPSRSGG